MTKKTRAESAKTKGKGNAKTIDISTIMQMANETLNAIEQFNAENPCVDVDALLSEHSELISALRRLSRREVDKFVAYAKEKGTAMTSDAMEMGILAAGRKDMQDGLLEIFSSLKFETPICSECVDKRIIAVK